VLSLRLLSCEVTSAAPPITIACPVELGKPNYQVVHALYQEAFQRLEREIEIVAMPEKRGYVEMTAGRIDAVCDINPSLIKPQGSNLILLRTVTFKADLLAFSYQANISIRSVQDLLSGRYTISYARGASAEQYIK
jgi:hypothetical protein